MFCPDSILQEVLKKSELHDDTNGSFLAQEMYQYHNHQRLIRVVFFTLHMYANYIKMNQPHAEIAIECVSQQNSRKTREFKKSIALNPEGLRTLL